jgi:hypothetical protein
MNTKTMIAMMLALPFQLQAATLILPATPATANSQNPSINPNVNVSIPAVATIQLDTVNAGTATTGAYTASATSGAYVALPLNLATLRLSSRTVINSSSITFGTTTTTTGVVGNILNSAPILSALVGANLTPQWSATIDLGDLGLNLQPSTTYDFNFSLAQNTSLLDNISPAVLNRFSVSVNDTSGTLPAQLLGLTDLTAASGTARFRFTTGAVVTDPTIRLSASALLDTDLLGSLLGTPNPNLYTVSNLNLTAIPEPQILPLLGIFGIVLLFRKRQR